MSLIEIAGFPRSGKTTTIKRVIESYPEVVFHPDILEVAPTGLLETDNTEEINFWYANFCADRQRRLIDDSKVNIMERGIMDRIAYGRASLEAGRMDPARFMDYLEILTSLEGTNDKTLLFLATPESSFARIRAPKKNPTQYLEFLRTLHKYYQILAINHPEITVVSGEITPDEQYSAVVQILTDPYQGILSQVQV